MKGTNVAVVVAAVVGSVAGLTLLVAAVCIGVRLEKNRSAAGKTGRFTKALPRVSVVWPSSTDEESRTNTRQSAVQPFFVRSSRPATQSNPSQDPGWSTLMGADEPQGQQLSDFTPLPYQHSWAGWDSPYTREDSIVAQRHELDGSPRVIHQRRWE
jgi:hypothetical protein